MKSDDAGWERRTFEHSCSNQDTISCDLLKVSATVWERWRDPLLAVVQLGRENEQVPVEVVAAGVHK